MGLKESDFLENSAIVSSSSRASVEAETIQEHVTIPEYPATSRNGVLHIIHLGKSPLPEDSENPTLLHNTTTDLMSNVSLRYEDHILRIC